MRIALLRIALAFMAVNLATGFMGVSSVRSALSTARNMMRVGYATTVNHGKVETDNGHRGKSNSKKFRVQTKS